MCRLYKILIWLIPFTVIEGFLLLITISSTEYWLEELIKVDLITEQKDITHAVNTHDKCGTPIEFLPTPQWFIKIMDKKDKLIEQGNKIKWHPEYMHKRYDNWVNGLSWDWNISRNRHCGIPIPAWECEDCNEIARMHKHAETELECMTDDHDPR